MAMTAKCANAVRAAASGRQISDARLRLVDEAIREQAQNLARADNPRWLGLTREQRTIEAAAAAMADVKAQAALTEFRAAQQILRNAEALERIKTQKGFGLTESQATVRVIEQAQIDGDTITRRAIGALGDLIDAVESTAGTGPLRNLGMRIFGLDNPAMTADIVREVMANASGFTGNTAAKAAAKAWLEVIERLRVRFNSAGGQIGKLGYGYLTQIHDAVKVQAAGAQAWAAKVAPLLDRNQYLRPDGQLMSPAEIGQLLLGAHKTIATEGANKVEPGQFTGSGARANKGSDHRVLHFKDGDAWMQYMQEFGEGTLYDSMIGHLGKMGRDLALIEHFGPNPEQWFKVQGDIAKRADSPLGRSAREWVDARSAGNTPEVYWKMATGATGTPEHRLVARIGSGMRNIQTAAKITMGPLSAMGDAATIAQTLHFNKIPYFQALGALGRQFSAEHRATLAAHGVVADSLVNTLNRFAGDHLTHGLTGRITNGVMRVSLMNAWTNTLRGAFSDVLMHNWAQKLGTKWADLSEWDQYLMQRKGLTEKDWGVITQSKATDINGRQFLMADAIGDAQIGDKWHSFVTDESMFAVVNPDAATRAIVTGGGAPAGTIGGEVFRSVAQFKSFPIAMLTRHWRRILETPQGLEGAPAGFGAESASGAVVNKVAVLAMLSVTATFMGAIQTQARQVAASKDPIDMTGEHAGKFWAKSWAAGGGAGFIADVLLAPADDPSRQWQGHFGLLGPVAGAAGGLIDVAKSKHKGAAALGLASDQLPFVDIWQTKSMYEKWFLHSAQENLNPGYLRRMRQRAQSQWGQDEFWTAGDLAPHRAPDIAGALGR